MSKIELKTVLLVTTEMNVKDFTFDQLTVPSWRFSHRRKELKSTISENIYFDGVNSVHMAVFGDLFDATDWRDEMSRYLEDIENERRIHEGG